MDDANTSGGESPVKEQVENFEVDATVGQYDPHTGLRDMEHPVPSTSQKVGYEVGAGLKRKLSVEATTFTEPEQEEGMNSMMTATKHLKSGSYGMIVKKRTVTGESRVKVNHGAGALGIAVLAEHSTVGSEVIEVMAKDAKRLLPAGPSGTQGHPKIETMRGRIAETIETHTEGKVLNNTTGLIAGHVHAHAINITQTTAQYGQQHQNPATSFWIVEPPIHTFEGRQDLLQITHEKLQERLSQKHFMKRIVALVAMGGMGKSETARMLPHTYKEFYENVAWIDAETETSAKTSFEKIAKILKLSHPDNIEGKELAELVYRHVGEHVRKPSLFIFDNAIQLKTEGDVFGIFDFLPSQVPENVPIILLTSQSTEWKINGCEVIEVTELSKEHSLDFFCARFKLSRIQREKDGSLQGLLTSLVERLNGYPLALGLAAANISYIPGQGSVELLKRNLKKYIQSVAENKILEQHVNGRLATNYPHTLLKVWDIAMANLERREHARGAKHLLSIIAHCAQERLYYFWLRPMYETRSETFGVTFPESNDTSFEEAVEELRTIVLARIHNDPEIRQPMVKIHRLFQALARRDDAGAISMPKLILHNLLDGQVITALPEGHFVEDKHIPGWALENEWKTLLWLHGLRFVKPQCPRAPLDLGHDLIWEDQLVKFQNGKDLATVAALIVRIKGAKKWSNATNWNSDLLWKRIRDVNKVQSSLVGPSGGIRAFLEHLLLSIVARSTEKFYKNLHFDTYCTDLSCPYTDVVADFNAWLHRFDFSAPIIGLPSLSKQIDSIMQTLSKVSFVIAIASPECRLLEPKILFRLADAQLALHDDDKKETAIIRLIDTLDVVWCPGDGEELVQRHNLLDHLSWVFKHDIIPSVKFQALRILQDLVRKSYCAQDVIQHDGLIESISLFTKWMATCDAVVVSSYYLRFSPGEQIRGRFPDVVAVVIEADPDERFILMLYRAMIAYFAIYAAVPIEECLAEGILAKMLPLSCCKSLESRMALSELRDPLRFFMNWQSLHSLSGQSLSKTELQEDRGILNCTQERLKRETWKTYGGEQRSLLLQLLESTFRLNGLFMNVITEAETLTFKRSQPWMLTISIDQ